MEKCPICGGQPDTSGKIWHEESCIVPKLGEAFGPPGQEMPEADALAWAHPDGSRQKMIYPGTDRRVVSVTPGRDGAVYVLCIDGSLWMMEPIIPTHPTRINIPKTE